MQGGVDEVIDQLVVELTSLYAVQDPVPDQAAIGQRLAARRQRKVPAPVVADGYGVVELIFVPLLRNFEWFEGISEALLGTNVDKWMQVSLVEVEISSGGVPSEQMTSDTLQAFLILLAYTAVLAAAAFVVFQRRDITGAKGG